jgi:NADH:ubiquinone oxidoreductase subunit 2 (subunit N)
MVSAVIAAYVYLRVMVMMWLAKPASAASRRVGMTGRLALGVSVFAAVVLGVLPSAVLRVAETLVDFAR